jgi:hypothetical protein
MGALAGGLGGGGGASVSASSSASSGPQSGTTGSLVLDFGGINLGNQDIPLNAESAAASNAPPLIGSVPNAATVRAMSAGGISFTTIALVVGVAALAWYIAKRKR